MSQPIDDAADRYTMPVELIRAAERVFNRYVEPTELRTFMARVRQRHPLVRVGRGRLTTMRRATQLGLLVGHAIDMLTAIDQGTGIDRQRVRARRNRLKLIQHRHFKRCYYDDAVPIVGREAIDTFDELFTATIYDAQPKPLRIRR